MHLLITQLRMTVYATVEEVLNFIAIIPYFNNTPYADKPVHYENRSQIPLLTPFEQQYILINPEHLYQHVLIFVFSVNGMLSIKY